MKTVTITCDLCEDSIVNYNEYPGVGEYRTHKLFGADVCEKCYIKVQAKLREFVLSLKPTKENR